ncbi:methyltransferase domain-containing protein [Pseudonocardia halophobica]|uniref:Methyltransferase type 12 n=1 Tax=Pseudonocardia halophobica TaxID=29401 RepID=A0A9W6NWF5_9PSEU|nr:methyltransferase domain-containing protein [Pseudonocardia halophobica]GLL11834.1 methyltransferase type 12 [Pseudonocardia halophobica]
MEGTPSERLADMLAGHVVVTMLALGHRLGLLEAVAVGPASAAEIAARAGADARYVREWLGALVGAGFVEVDATGGTYRFAEDAAGVLSGPTAANLAPVADMLVRLTGMAPEVAARFGDGTGIPPQVYAERAGEALGGSRRWLYEERFVAGFLGPVPGLADRLRAGARVLDVGCGSGQVARLVADAFPASTVTGVDVVPEAVAAAEAGRGDRSNLRYEVADAAALPGQAGSVDVVLAVDVVHDLADPGAALRGIRRLLAPDGLFVMVDISYTGHLPDLAGDSGATSAFGISVLHCLPVSLSGGGAGLGAMWGHERAEALLAEAGFAMAARLPSPRPQNAIYVARPVDA